MDNSVISLGSFEKVSLTEAWPTEDRNFTPWLAEPANIKMLGDALRLELEVESVEHWVGIFRADILARVINETDHRVIIENQFGRTNHGHLGQLLTYLAGIEGGKTVVWIAETIQPDHRAALDWLNANTIEQFSFFAIEIELWRINQSPPAPRFNVIASPNDWTKTARSASRVSNDEDFAERHHVRLAYWSSFSVYLKSHNPAFQIRRPNRDHWFEFSIGRTGFAISATISTDKNRVGVELYNHNDPEKIAFESLLADRDSIEQEFGEVLDWQKLPSKKATRIVIYLSGVDPSDKSNFEHLHQWMLNRMERFRRVFSSRVKNLPVSTYQEGANP